MSHSNPRHEFSATPLFFLACSFCTGILTEKLVNPSYKNQIAFLVILFVVLIVFLRFGRFAVTTWLLLGCFAIVGSLNATIEAHATDAHRISYLYDSGQYSSDDPVEVTGVLSSEPESTLNGYSLDIKVEQFGRPGKPDVARGRVGLWLTTDGSIARREFDALDLRYGTRIRVLTKLDRDEQYRNPGSVSRKSTLARVGLDATGTIKSTLLIERLGDERVFIPLALAYRWRTELIEKTQSTFSRQTAGLLNASILGNRYGLSKELGDQFREGGAFHILVISGFHIALMGWFLFWCVSHFSAKGVIRFLLPLVLIWLYTIAVGAGLPVIRAAFVFSFVSFANVLNRRASSLNGLGAAIIALLILRPSDIYDPSFQLTILSVMAIVGLAWPVNRALMEVGSWRPSSRTPFPPACRRWFRVAAECLHWSEKDWRAEMTNSPVRYRLFKTRVAASLERYKIQPVMRLVVSAMLISTAIQIGLLPLQIVYFHRLSLFSIIINLVAAPLTAAIMLFAVLAMLIGSVWHALSSVFVTVTEKLCYLALHLVDPFAFRGVTSLRIPQYSRAFAAIYIAYFLVLVFAGVRLQRWNPLKPILAIQHRSVGRYFFVVVGVVCAVLIISHPYSVRPNDGHLRIDFIDVGQGDSALVTMPDNTTLLIDGGGRPAPYVERDKEEDGADAESFHPDTRSIGEAVVSEFLWSRGLDHVDYILATHADADHIDGLSDIARNFRVRSAIVARHPNDDPEFIRFDATMKRENVPIEVLNRGSHLSFGDVTADVVWPERVENENAPSQNNDSLVLRLKFGNRTFLLTGDMEQEAEKTLLSDNEDLACDLIKVGHHGSDTSSAAEFVNATHPQFAVISVGLTSPFGHPKKSVVDRWRNSGARVLTTGANGTITVTTDGRNLEVNSFVNGPVN